MRDLKGAENEACASHRGWHHQTANARTLEVTCVVLFMSVRGSLWTRAEASVARV